MELDRERAAADVARLIAVLTELRALLTKEGPRIHGVQFAHQPDATEVGRREELTAEAAALYGRLRPALDAYGVPQYVTPSGGGRTAVFVQVTDANDPNRVSLIADSLRFLHIARGAISGGPPEGRASASTPKSVFLARSFHADDEKVSREVEGMLHALGYRVVSGESSEAKEVSEKVKERIESCDVTVALMTPFHGPNGLEARPSPWVVSELAWARAQGRTGIVILEKSIPRSEIGGINADLETIPLAAGEVEVVHRKLTEMIRAAEGMRQTKVVVPASDRSSRVGRIRAGYEALLASAMSAAQVAGELRLLYEGETEEKRNQRFSEALRATAEKANAAAVSLRLEDGTDDVLKAFYGVWNFFYAYQMDVEMNKNHPGSVPSAEVRKDKDLMDHYLQQLQDSARRHLSELER